jgi:TPR repeat protein
MGNEFSELKENAKSGDSAAQYKLAICYIEGKKVQKDVAEGCKWLEVSAKSGNINAQVALADQYAASKNYAASVSWYNKAATQGHPDAMYKMGLLMIYAKRDPESVSKGESLIRDSANKGNINAQYELALIYLRGGSSFHLDGEEALRWLKNSADKGHLLSINKLGYLYSTGTSDKKVKVDIEQAIHYWELASKSGFSESQYNLAMLYLDKSMSLWDISSSNGFKKSKYMLNLMKGANNK